MKSKAGPGRWLTNLGIYAVMIFFAGIAIFPVALTICVMVLVIAFSVVTANPLSVFFCL